VLDEVLASREQLTELLAAKTQNYCLTGEVGQIARWRAAHPWRWRRVLAKWFVEMKREELLKQIHAKEKTMLMVSGSAEFKNEGKVLETVLRIQPQFEKQHELLAKVAATYGEIGGMKMEKGILVIERNYLVEIAPSVQEAASAPQSESSSTSVADTADPLPKFMPGDRVQWISQGAYHFAEPMHILRMSDDGKFAFFEGSETGVPVEQLEAEPVQ